MLATVLMLERAVRGFYTSGAYWMPVTRGQLNHGEEPGSPEDAFAISLFCQLSWQYITVGSCVGN